MRWAVAVAVAPCLPSPAWTAEQGNPGTAEVRVGDEDANTSRFSDVQPTDWAYQALRNLIENHGCVEGFTSGAFDGGRAITRYEAAALLNACLNRVTVVTDELQGLIREFRRELALLKGRVDGLEARVGELEAVQFSTTTKLSGVATFVIGANAFGGNNNVPGVSINFPNGVRNGANAFSGATVFNYDLKVRLDTSFTGADLLRITLRQGNFISESNPFGNGTLSTLKAAFQEDGPASFGRITVNRIYYRAPLGSDWSITVGGKVSQDDMLALWPSAYPTGDGILDLFTYAGAPAAYDRNLGAGIGLAYKAKSGFAASLNYVAGNADNGAPGSYSFSAACGDTGGIGAGRCSDQSFTVQMGYGRARWGMAAVYTYLNANDLPGSTPIIGGSEQFNRPGISTFSNGNSFGLSGYWKPKRDGWIPSVSIGWGYTLYGPTVPVPFVVETYPYAVAGVTGIASQSWMVGLQWANAFRKGNALGMAVGQPNYVANSGTAQGPPQDGQYAWEWWYKFQLTDHIAVTPALFYLSGPLGQYNKTLGSRAGIGDPSLTQVGGLLKTTFRF